MGISSTEKHSGRGGSVLGRETPEDSISKAASAIIFLLFFFEGDDWTRIQLVMAVLLVLPLRKVSILSVMIRNE